MKKYGGPETIYGLGVLGAAVYFIQHTSGLWGVLIALAKAVLWPALVMYKTLELLKL